MTAWAEGAPDQAGSQILPFLDVGLRDPDRDVRLASGKALQKIESSAIQARVMGRTVALDPRSYQPLVDTVWRLLDDPDTEMRKSAVLLVARFDMIPSPRTEAAILERLPAEKNPGVRGRMVDVLSLTASKSQLSRAAVLQAFDDPATDVQTAAIDAMSRLKLPEAMPKLEKIMRTGSQSYVRVAATKTLERYGVSARSYVAAAQTQLSVETDAKAKAALEHFITNMQSFR